MIAAEAEERQHLTDVVDSIRQALRALDTRRRHYAHDIKEQKAYLWESKADMDRVEKAFTRQTIEQSVMTPPCNTRWSPGSSRAPRPSWAIRSSL